MNRLVALVSFATAVVMMTHATLARPESTIGQKSAGTPSFDKSPDDWERAKLLLEAAKSGDRDAQYLLFAVIDDCETLMGYHFTHDGLSLTLDEGLERAANASQKHQAQEGFLHCHRFLEHNVALELGSADYWLEKATQSGQPLAQAVTARRRLDQDFRDTAVPLTGSACRGLVTRRGQKPRPAGSRDYR